jgi:hypothetical protein
MLIKAFIFRNTFCGLFFIDVQPSKNLPVQSENLQMKEANDYQEFKDSLVLQAKISFKQWFKVHQVIQSPIEFGQVDFHVCRFRF